MSNPASRLHAILSRASDLSGDHSLQTAEGWKRILHLPADVDDLAVMNKVGRVFTMPDLVAREIERFSDLDTDLYLGWRKDLTDAFHYVGFQFAFREFASRLSKSLLINIKFCAHELEKRVPEKEISKDELEQIREEVWQLYSEILKSDLPPMLSRYALDHLFLIIEAIDNYLVTGADGIEYALDAAIGATFTANATSKEVAESSFGDRYWKVMGRVATALTLGKAAVQLADFAQNALSN
jgi:hypothetical protein